MATQPYLAVGTHIEICHVASLLSLVLWTRCGSGSAAI